MSWIFGFQTNTCQVLMDLIGFEQFCTLTEVVIGQACPECGQAEKHGQQGQDPGQMLGLKGLDHPMNDALCLTCFHELFA